jgi:hypothetical protein
MTENPNIGKDEKDRTGEVCPRCGKGILLIDMDCVRENNSCVQCMNFVPLIFCVICWRFLLFFKILQEIFLHKW